LICDLCATDSCQTNATQHCCKIRRLAKAPGHARAEQYAALSKEDAAELGKEVSAEYKRLQTLKEDKSQAAQNLAMESIRKIK
jgi:hypothetical protein